MTIEDKKRELALNRIQQAEESLEEAEYLFDGKKSPRSESFISAAKDYLQALG